MLEKGHGTPCSDYHDYVTYTYGIMFYARTLGAQNFRSS